MIANEPLVKKVYGNDTSSVPDRTVVTGYAILYASSEACEKAHKAKEDMEKVRKEEERVRKMKESWRLSRPGLKKSGRPW